MSLIWNCGKNILFERFFIKIRMLQWCSFKCLMCFCLFYAKKKNWNLCKITFTWKDAIRNKKVFKWQVSSKLTLILNLLYSPIISENKSIAMSLNYMIYLNLLSLFYLSFFQSESMHLNAFASPCLIFWYNCSFLQSTTK